MMIRTGCTKHCYVSPITYCGLTMFGLKRCKYASHIKSVSTLRKEFLDFKFSIKTPGHLSL